LLACAAPSYPAAGTGSGGIRPGSRRRVAWQSLQKLYELSRKAKIALDCSDQLETKINTLLELYNQDTSSFALYFELNKQASAFLQAGLAIPDNIEGPRMKLIEDLFGSGVTTLYKSVDSIVGDIAQTLKSQLPKE
jgi:hypothetical protein